jgi:hypothetical protein
MGILILIMLGFLILFPPIGWAIFLCICYLRTFNSNIRRSFKYLLFSTITIIGLTPFHGLLVIPLIEEECKTQGNESVYASTENLPSNILIDDNFLYQNNPYPISDLLFNSKIKSVSISSQAGFGEGRYIRSAAAEYGNKPFTLSKEKYDSLNCGPFFSWAISKGISYDGDECVAYSNKIEFSDYVKIRKSKKYEKSNRTLWHTINWETTIFEVISKQSTHKIVELREFSYVGLVHPIFPDMFQYGIVSCKAPRDAHSVLKDLFQNASISQSEINNNSTYDKKLLTNLVNKFFGFELPTRIKDYSVRIYSTEGSSETSPIKIKIIEPISEMPISISVATKEYVVLDIVQNNQNNSILILEYPKKSYVVNGIEQNKVIIKSRTDNSKNHLYKFYLGFLNGRLDYYCSIQGRAVNNEINVDLSKCSPIDRNLTLNEF